MIKTDSELLIKYCVPSIGDYSKLGSELCAILHRFDKDSKLNEADKTWIKNKGMFRYKTVVFWSLNAKYL